MRLRPLHPDFGAEVCDFDVLTGGAPDDIAALREAFDAHQLLLFRGARPIPPERQVELAGWFGPPVANSPDGAFCTVLHNDEAAGRLRLPFHSDLSYTDAPIHGLSLHALEIPSNGTVTSFVSSVQAWKSLPPERQSLLAEKTLLHRLGASIAYGDWPEFLADHPVRLVHPRTGEPILYVTEHHATRIHELDAETSERILAELFAHLYAPERVYMHAWARHDLVVWDNLAVQHARPEIAEPADGARAMQRVALSDTPYYELVERAWGQQRERERQAAQPAE
jgi:taurine dioxygenase